MNNHIGDLIKSNRAKMGLSLSGLAKASGLSKAQIWDLERGKSRNPTINTIKTLAKHLDISVYCFIEIDGD